MNTPVLLIPGLNGSARLYQDQLPQLWRRGPVMVADHRTADNVAGMARQILAVAPARFSLAGFSLGGFIAFEILRQSPERVERLALLSSNAVPKPPDPEQTRIMEERIVMAQTGRFAELSALHFPRNVHPARREDEALRLLHRTMTDDVGPQGYVNQQRAIWSRPDSRPLLASIACPTLIVVGEDDEVTPPQRAQDMHGAIDGSALVVLRQCGHLSPLEQPEAVTRALLEWLDRA
jgi:pimeloyl-ACP methyl ester carboxylesterase